MSVDENLNVTIGVKLIIAIVVIVIMRVRYVVNRDNPLFDHDLRHAIDDARNATALGRRLSKRGKLIESCRRCSSKTEFLERKFDLAYYDLETVYEYENYGSKKLWEAILSCLNLLNEKDVSSYVADDKKNKIVGKMIEVSYSDVWSLLGGRFLKRYFRTHPVYCDEFISSKILPYHRLIELRENTKVIAKAYMLAHLRRGDYLGLPDFLAPEVLALIMRYTCTADIRKPTLLASAAVFGGMTVSTMRVHLGFEGGYAEGRNSQVFA